MKKVWCIVLALMMSVMVCACVEDTPRKEVGDSVSSVQQQTDETFALNETAVFSDLKFTANQLVTSQGEDFFTPDTGNVFVGIQFTIENISDEEQTISSLLLFDGYVDDTKCDYSVSAGCVFDDGTLDGSIAPGKKLVGWYAVEVPKTWSAIELQVRANLFSDATAKFVFTNEK